MKHLQALVRLLPPLLVASLLLSGCSNKPFLTPDNSYAIVTYDSQGNSRSIPINLSWNTNTAVLRQLLMEASFVLSDLRSEAQEPTRAEESSSPGALSSQHELPASLPVDKPSSSQDPSAMVAATSLLPEKLSLLASDKENRTYLQTTFPKTTMLTFLLDGQNVNLGVQSIEIEVEGDDLGQVILNGSWVLQGIANPNLYPAYLKLIDMLKGKENSAGAEGGR